MTSERHRPTSWMILVSTRPQRRAIAPPARHERAETSSALKPSCGPRILADVRMVSVTSLEEMVHQALVVVLRTTHSGASGGAPCWRR
jgi:hypothetical protein